MRQTIVLIILFFAVLASAAESPVALNHKVTAKKKNTDTTEVSLLVHVRNTSNKTISDLTLSFINRSPFFTDRTTLNIATLAPQDNKEITLQFRVPAVVDTSNYFDNKPLYWAGNCVDDQGQSLEFPVTSRTERTRPSTAAKLKDRPAHLPATAGPGGSR